MNDPGDETNFHDVAGANVRHDQTWIKVDPRYDVKPIGKPIRIPPLVPSSTFEALTAVATERLRQDEKWGIQNHEPGYWNAVLGEEFGEASEAALNFIDYGPLVASPKKPKMSTADHYRQELIHVAAVAVAMIEQLDREAQDREAIINRMPPSEREAWRRIYAHVDDDTELARQQREAGQ